MTTRLNAFTQAACISLLFFIVPGISFSQEQNVPAAQQSENTGGPAEQKQTPASNATGTIKEQVEQMQTQKPEEPYRQLESAATPTSMESTATPTPTENTEYTIKQGDTLWDISNTFLKDPFLWPFIWKANPYITNPDLIYAGNKLLIPSMAPIERAMEAPAEAAPKEEAPPVEGAIRPKPVPTAPPAAVEEVAPAEGGRLIMPEERPAPIIDKYSMLSAGFVNNAENDDMIVGAAETGKTIFGYDDIVYVKIHSKENVNVGDKYLIYAPLEKVRHPKTGKRYGRLIRGQGILQITAKDSSDVLTARISLSFDAIDTSSLLTPYQEPALIYHPAKRAKDISGYILHVADHHRINGQTDIVYLDKGSVDGVEPGDRFLVYAEPEKRGFPRKEIGEVLVFLVKERTATAVVSKSREEMGKGNQIDFEK